jgi:hypothetical protein
MHNRLRIRAMVFLAHDSEARSLLGSVLVHKRVIVLGYQRIGDTSDRNCRLATFPLGRYRIADGYGLIIAGDGYRDCGDCIGTARALAACSGHQY